MYSLISLQIIQGYESIVENINYKHLQQKFPTNFDMFFE